MKTRTRRGVLARTAIAVLCALALAGAPSGVRADDVPLADESGGEELVWNWNKFFDYAGCAVAIVVTVGDAGVTWAPTMLVCARAVALHMSD